MITVQFTIVFVAGDQKHFGAFTNTPNGQLLPSKYFDGNNSTFTDGYNYVVKSEDSQYSDTVAETVTTVYYDLKQYFYSSMGFNKY